MARDGYGFPALFPSPLPKSSAIAQRGPVTAPLDRFLEVLLAVMTRMPASEPAESHINQDEWPEVTYAMLVG